MNSYLLKRRCKNTEKMWVPWSKSKKYFFCCAKADRASSLVGQKFSYMLRGRAIIAKNLGTRKHQQETKTKTTNKTTRLRKKEVPRELGEKVKLTRPKISALSRSPLRKSDFPFNLPFCTTCSQVQHPSADNPHNASTNVQKQQVIFFVAIRFSSWHGRSTDLELLESR